MKFKRLATVILSAVTALGLSLSAAAEVYEEYTESVSVKTYAAGDNAVYDVFLFTELEDGTYEVGYNYNGPKPVGTLVIPETAYGRPITRIAEAGFYGCSEVTDVIIPEGVINIGANAFTGTAFLNNQPGPVKYAGKVAVYCDPNAENIAVADGTLGLADKLFVSAKNLKAVSLPEGLKNMGFCTFDGCSKLVSVYIPSSVTVIQSGVFSGCTALSSITIPQSVREIGAYAFESSGITAADLTNVTKIGKGAFENSRLAADSVIVNGGYIEVGGRAFEGTPFYNALGSEKYLGSVFLGCDKNFMNVVIRDGTTAIAGMAFSGCKSLMDVVIPYGVVTIGEDAFFNCPVLTSIALPETVTRIGKDAFRLCTKLRTVSLPLSLAASERGAFYGCDAIETVTYPGSLLNWRNIGVGDNYALPSVIPIFGQEPSIVEPVAGLAVAGISESAIAVAWAPHSLATKYQIDIYRNGTWTKVGEVDSSVTSFTVTGLDQCTDYSIRVYAYVHNVYSAASSVSARTLLTMPTGFTGRGNSESIVLSWDKNPAAENYQIDIFRDGAWQYVTRTANNDVTSYKVTGLAPSTAYYFRVFAIRGSDSRVSPEIAVATDPLPVAPTGLSATSTTDSVTLTWNPAPYADSYEVDAFLNGKWTFIGKTPATGYAVTGLAPGTSYQFRVYSFNDTTYSSSSAKLTASTLRTDVTPAVVTGFTASSTANSVTLSWNPTAYAESYQIDVYQNGVWKYLTKTTGTGFTHSGLSANTSYQYRIFACNGSLYSNTSAKVTATTKSAASSSGSSTTPSAVTGFTASTTTGSVSLSWNKATNADSYQIDVYQNGAWQYLTKTTGTGFTHSGLSANTSYQYRIFAFNGSLYSSSTKLTATTKSASSGSSSSATPSAVTGFTASSTANSITLSWNKSANADSYQIDVYQNGKWSYVAKTNATSYTVTQGLKAGTSYQFRIFAFNGSLYSSSTKLTASLGASGSSSGSSATPSAVTGFTASTAANSITLSWNKAANADSYQIDVYQNGTWKYLTKTTGTSFTHSGLSASTNYQYRIFAFNGSKYSNSAKLTAVTSSSGSSSATPSAVTGFTASPTSSTIKLSWNKVSNADSYQIDVYQNGKWSYVAKTTSTSYTVTQGLKAGTSYQFRIFAFNGSKYSTSTKLTTSLGASGSGATPSAVTGLKASSTSSTITLSWNKATNADSYQIDVYQNGQWSYVAKTTSTSYTVTQGLKIGTSYQFRIFAFNGSKYSSSTKITASLAAVAAPTAYSAYDTLSGTQIKLKGIDVSGWQGTIDFNTVKESGVDFVIVKAGEQYNTVETWEINYANAKRAGLLVGAYWFSYATTPADAQREAQAFINAMKGKQLDFPVYLDIERSEQFAIGLNACTAVVDTFCATLDNAGFYSGVYCSTYWYTNYVSESVRLKRPAWIADYRGGCYYDAAYGMWQYGYGKVSGVQADDCDLNWGYIDYSKFILSHRKNGY